MSQDKTNLTLARRWLTAYSFISLVFEGRKGTCLNKLSIQVDTNHYQCISIFQ